MNKKLDGAKEEFHMNDSQGEQSCQQHQTHNFPFTEPFGKGMFLLLHDNTSHACQGGIYGNLSGEIIPYFPGSVCMTFPECGRGEKGKPHAGAAWG